MNARGRLAGLTLIIVVLCTLGYALAGQGIVWPLLGLVCVGANLLLHGIEGKDEYMLPRWIVIVAAIGVLAWGVTRAAGGFKIDALCECVLALMFVKLWDRKTPGDYAQILTLAVYLAIGCTVRGDFVPFMIVAMCVPAILCATMLFQISSGQYRFTRHGARPSVVRWSNWSFATFFSAGFALIAAIGTLIFIFMPRGPMLESTGWNSPVSWVARLGGIARISGFNNQVELGRGGLISDSRAVVAEVKIVASDDKMPLDILHLRGAVLDSYDKGSWKERANPSKSDSEVDSQELKRGEKKTFGGRPHIRSAARSVELHVTLRDVDRTIPLFAPWWPSSIEFFTPDRLSLDTETLILKRNGKEGAFQYAVQSTIGSSVDPGESESRRPEDRPKVSFPSRIVQDLTREVLKKALIEPDPAKRMPSEDSRAARVIEAHLRREYKYTTHLLAAPEGTDPIDWFLTTSKQGHCEYFASAMVAMCRSVGIPARLITGYVAAEASGPKSFVVRQSNAHAWVEAAVDGFPPQNKGDMDHSPLRWHSWRTFDPTPPSDFLRIHQPEPTMTLKVGKFLSSLETAWSSNILRFDDHRQSTFLGTQSSTNWLETKLARISNYLDDGNSGGQRGVPLQLWIWALLIIFLLFAIPMAIKFLLRRLWSRRRTNSLVAPTGLDSRIEQLRNSYVAALRRRSIDRPLQESLFVHLDRCEETLRRIHDSLPQEATRLIKLLYLGQFGNGLTKDQYQEAFEIKDRIERLLASENRGAAG